MNSNVFVAVVVLALLVGCDSVAQYKGDGKLVDNGLTAAKDRYVLHLGDASLRSATTKTFKIRDLPKENYVIGIDLRAPEGSKIDPKAIGPVVSIKLTEDGKSLLEKQGKLSDWTWSILSPGDRAFVYDDSKPGTYFDALPGKDYELTFVVKEPDRGQFSYTASLVAKSGGWK
jgi:hypothetical protein